MGIIPSPLDALRETRASLTSSFFTHPLVLSVLLLIILPFLLYLIDIYFLTPPYPKGVPLIREPPNARRFSLRTRLAFYRDNNALQREAWELYLKRGKPVIVPLLGYSSELIMPPSSLKWINSQPESVIGMDEAFAHFDQIYYSLGHDKYMMDHYQGKLVKGFNLEVMAEEIWDEMAECFGRWVDTDREGMVWDVPGIREGEAVGKDDGGWKEIHVEKVVRMMIAQLTSRFIVGLPLCGFLFLLLFFLFPLRDSYFLCPSITYPRPSALYPPSSHPL